MTTENSVSIVRKGTIWLHESSGETVEFLKDFYAGDVATASGFLINGQEAHPGDIIPSWMVSHEIAWVGAIPTILHKVCMDPPSGVVAL